MLILELFMRLCKDHLVDRIFACLVDLLYISLFGFALSLSVQMEGFYFLSDLSWFRCVLARRRKRRGYN